jgi:hypothetical protein
MYAYQAHAPTTKSPRCELGKQDFVMPRSTALRICSTDVRSLDGSLLMTYSGHLLKTRRQALWFVWAAVGVLVPVYLRAAYQLRQTNADVLVPLAAVTALPFLIFYRAWKFLDAQEPLHATPTPEMNFAFEMLAVTPLAGTGMLLALLFALAQ